MGHKTQPRKALMICECGHRGGVHIGRVCDGIIPTQPGMFTFVPVRCPCKKFKVKSVSDNPSCPKEKTTEKWEGYGTIDEISGNGFLETFVDQKAAISRVRARRAGGYQCRLMKISVIMEEVDIDESRKVKPE